MATGEETLEFIAKIPGAVLPYAGASAPTGWLLANGAAVSRTTYAGLFAVTSTTFGVGDGSTTFNVPNLTGRTPVGVDTSAKTVIEDCEDAWNELVDGDVTASLDGVDYKVGSGSAKFVCAAGLGAGDIIATEVIAPNAEVFHGKTHISFWFKTTVALDAGDLALLLDNTGSCASPLETIDIPAIIADTWTRVYLPLANAGDDNTIISIGLKQVVDKGAMTLNIDDIAIGEAMELGLKGGEGTHAIIESELAAHTHTYNYRSGTITTAPGGAGTDVQTPNTGSTGGDKAHTNMQPYLTLNYIIKT